MKKYQLNILIVAAALLMLGIPRASVHRDAPVPRHLYGQVSRRAETIEPQLPAFLDSREAQRSKSDDPRAQQGCRLLVREPLGNGINKILGGHKATPPEKGPYPMPNRMLAAAWNDKTDAGEEQSEPGSHPGEEGWHEGE